ncbi:hypothetical protein [Methanococcus sp. CF]
MEKTNNFINDYIKTSWNTFFKKELSEYSLISLILSFITLIFFKNTFLDNFGSILGVFATVLSIVISTTFIVIQLASNTYGSDIWKLYSENDHIKFYLFILSISLILGILLIFGQSTQDYVNLLNISVFLNSFLINWNWRFNDYSLILMILGFIESFILFFSILLVPKYFFNLMSTLKPENILKNILTSIDKKELNLYNNSKSKYDSAEEIQTYSLDMITNIFKVLVKQEQYKTVKNCMDLLSEKYLEELFKKYEYSELNGFLNYYSLLIRNIGVKKHPYEVDTEIKISAITSLETIAMRMIGNDKNAWNQMIFIPEIVVSKIHNYNPDEVLEDPYIFQECSLNNVITTAIDSLEHITIQLLTSAFKGSEEAKSRIPYLFKNLAYMAIRIFDKIAEESKNQNNLIWLCSDLPPKIINVLNENSFEYIEKSTDENEVSFLINSLIDSYSRIIFNKNYNLELDSKLIFEEEHKLMAESIYRLINLHEFENYIQYIKNKEELIKILSDEYFKKWISENKYENRVEEIKMILSDSK